MSARRWRRRALLGLVMAIAWWRPAAAVAKLLLVSRFDLGVSPQRSSGLGCRSGYDDLVEAVRQLGLGRPRSLWLCGLVGVRSIPCLHSGTGCDSG
jgi:hypothetical protein